MSKFNFNIDNIEDNEISLSKSKYNSKSLKELLELYNNVVDLGLPSETLWCKYNLGSSKLTIGDAGNFYAWGETQPKETYTWDTYEYGSGPYDLYK